MKPRRMRTRVTDAHGAEVCVGDRVHGLGVNTHLRGTVVQLDMHPGRKPCVVQTDEGHVVFMNPSWTEKEDPS